MATNAGPCYGKQYIRYAETWEAPTDNEAGDVGVVEVGEFRVVTYATYAGAFKAAQPVDVTSFTDAVIGVNQAYMPTCLASPHTARQLTVATSGLLLIEVDPVAGVIDLNTSLQINPLGQATDAGVEVLVDSTNPKVRENIEIAGRRMVLVSFN